MNTTTRKDQGHEHLERAKDAAGSAVEKGKEAAGTVMEKAKDVASNVASSLGSTAGNVATAIGHTAENATAAVGRGMESVGEKIREKGPEKGILGSATRGVAGALESSGKYLEEKNLSGMAEDVTNLIKRNPIPALLIGIGVGFLLSRMLRS